MDTIQVQGVIMAGGSGTRLWPLSRAGYPKQFLVLEGNSSLFQQAAQRIAALAAGPDAQDLTLLPALIVGNEEHRFLVLDQLRETALEPGAGFQRLQRAVREAANGAIVILGITPERPETGYGYIRTEKKGAALAVAQFVEKPDLATAERYLAEGSYFWNSGMFVLRASSWIAALGRFRPDILDTTRQAYAARKVDDKFVRPGKAEFAAVPSESVDYAVMERCPGSDIPLLMVELDAGWNDLGAWEAVWQVGTKDEFGNVLRGDAIASDSRNTLVQATSRLVSVVGLDDVVVVETPDAVLVADRSKSQDVKKIVQQLEKSQRGEMNLHRKVHRPWGWYDSIDAGERFQVKRIMVKPGASLSLQMHHHRAEHWIVVSGTAEITNGDKVLLLSENQSTYIPLGQTHRLANPGRLPLEIIEVQSGSYLGEDDIVRFEDTYGRK